MSGTIVNNVARASGTIAATPGGLDWSTAVVTGSTVTVEAGRGYFINTTSNACTVTLPASPEVGDQIVLTDYARTWATNAVTIDSNGNNFQGEADTYIVDYSTVGQSLNIVYADSTKGWLPVSDDAVADVPVVPVTQKGIFAFGTDRSSNLNTRNLVNSSGVIAADASGAGTVRAQVAATSYGTDKAIFRGGRTSGAVGMSNLVSNSGVVASDVSVVGTAAQQQGAATYGGISGGKAIFGFGNNGETLYNISNLVSNLGVVSADVTGVGTARYKVACVSFGGDKAIFAYGQTGSGNVSMSNLVSNSGVVASDVGGVGTARNGPSGTTYGSSGQAAIVYGLASSYTNIKNLISSSGVVASDASGVGTVRNIAGSTNYGGDKGIVGYGQTTSETPISLSNLISNTGVVAADVSGVGTARESIAAAGYSLSA